MKRTKTLLLIAILSFFGFAGKGQEVKPRALLDSSILLIGDQVHLRVEIEYPSQFDVQFPVPPDSLAEFVEILERSSVDTLMVGPDRKMLSQNFLITSFDSGQHVISPFWFNIHFNGMIDSIPSNALLLNVFTLPKIDSLMQALKGPIDIKAPYEAPVTLKEVAPWILGSLLAFGLIFLVLYALRRKQKHQPIFALPQKPKEPAHIVAIRELDRIKEEKIWQQGKTKLYYSEISDVLRKYIEDRFSIPSMEQTTDETLAAFKYRRSLLDERSFENLKKILTNADLVKFAKYEPLPDDNNLALVDSYFFINQTKQVEAPAPKEPLPDDREGDDVAMKG